MNNFNQNNLKLVCNVNRIGNQDIYTCVNTNKPIINNEAFGQIYPIPNITIPKKDNVGTSGFICDPFDYGYLPKKGKCPSSVYKLVSTKYGDLCVPQLPN